MSRKRRAFVAVAVCTLIGACICLPLYMALNRSDGWIPPGARLVYADGAAKYFAVKDQQDSIRQVTKWIKWRLNQGVLRDPGTSDFRWEVGESASGVVRVTAFSVTAHDGIKVVSKPDECLVEVRKKPLTFMAVIDRLKSAFSSPQSP